MPHPTTPESVPALAGDARSATRRPQAGSSATGWGEFGWAELGWIETSWRKSSHSGDQGACVEMATGADAVAVRDSKDPTGPVLRFPATAWTAFTSTPPRP